MLESIREDAGGQLISHGEQEYAVPPLHLLRRAGLPSPAPPHQRQPATLGGSARESDNLRAVLAWLGGHDKSALRLAADLAWLWYHDGHLRRRPSVA